jgi:hypothetical protein
MGYKEGKSRIDILDIIIPQPHFTCPSESNWTDERRFSVVCGLEYALKGLEVPQALDNASATAAQHS